MLRLFFPRLNKNNTQSQQILDLPYPVDLPLGSHLRTIYDIPNHVKYLKYPLLRPMQRNLHFTGLFL